MKVQMKLLAGETQYERSAPSTCFGLGCVLACVHVFGSLTDICCEGQISVCMEPINRASGRTPLPAIIFCTGTLRRIRPAESQYSLSSAALMHSLHSQVSTSDFSLHKRRILFFFLQSKPTPTHMIYALKYTHTHTRT